MKNIGDLISDLVTNSMATWTFIITFLALCLFEIWGNSHGLLHFDPTMLVLNTILSLMAAIQGSIIMMSQNRQADRDRQRVVRIEEMDEHITQKVDEMSDEILEELAIAKAERDELKEVIQLLHEKLGDSQNA